MAKKKRTLKAEVIDEAGEVNLTGTTKLEFSLNKADIIDFYCAEEEEKLEAEINGVARELSKLDTEVASLRKQALSIEDADDDDDGEYAHQNFNCPDSIKDALLKSHKKTIDAAKKSMIAAVKALSKVDAIATTFSKIGRLDPDEEEETNSKVKNLKVTVAVNLRHQNNHHQRYGHDAFPWSTRRTARNPLKGHRRQLGRGISESLLHDLPLGAAYWKQYTSTFSAREHLTCQMTLNVNFDCDGNNWRLRQLQNATHSGLIKVPLEGEYLKLVQAYVDKANSRGVLMKKLHDLLIKHAELPQMKKAIKKQVVGRVLKNTDEGKLLLTALKGIRKTPGVKLLTDATTAVENAQ